MRQLFVWEQDGFTQDSLGIWHISRDSRDPYPRAHQVWSPAEDVSGFPHFWKRKFWCSHGTTASETMVATGWPPASFIHLTNTYWMPVMCQGLLERLNVPIFRHFQPNHTAFPLKIRYDTSTLWRKQSPQNLSDGPSRWQVYSLQEKRQTNQSQSSSGDRIYILWEPSILPFGLLQHL